MKEFSYISQDVDFNVTVCTKMVEQQIIILNFLCNCNLIKIFSVNNDASLIWAPVFDPDLDCYLCGVCTCSL